MITAKAGVLVRTSAAARDVGVSKRTLQQWVQDGVVVPTTWTPGGHARWEPGELRRQLDQFHRAWS